MDFQLKLTFTGKHFNFALLWVIRHKNDLEFQSVSPTNCSLDIRLLVKINSVKTIAKSLEFDIFHGIVQIFQNGEGSPKIELSECACSVNYCFTQFISKENCSTCPWPQHAQLMFQHSAKPQLLNLLLIQQNHKRVLQPKLRKYLLNNFHSRKTLRCDNKSKMNIFTTTH